MTDPIGLDTEPDPVSFDGLPSDIIAAVLLKLELNELRVAASASTKLRDVALDDTLVWQPLCELHFGHNTRPSHWLKSAPCTTPAAAPENAAPAAYRGLFQHLCRLRKLVGLWTGMGTGPRGMLYQVQWDSDSLVLSQLSVCHMDLGVQRKLLLRVGSSFPETSVQMPDDSFCVIKRHPSCLLRAPCTAAQAATEVATSSSSSSPLADKLRPLGSSPPSPFSQEMLSFMHKCVAGSRSSSGGKRRARKSGSSTSLPAAPPVTYHLRRINPPQPTLAHPLAGIWQGLYVPHGTEIIRVSYNFTSANAELHAVKLTGDPNVPAGEITWKAVAAALPEPWDVAEVGLMNLYHASDLDPEIDTPAPRVVSCHEGYGQEADHGFVNAMWCPGRLWVYDDGRIAFVWQPHVRIVYKRMDALLEAMQYQEEQDVQAEEG